MKTAKACMGLLAAWGLAAGMPAAGQTGDATATKYIETANGVDWIYSLAKSGAILESASQAEGAVAVPAMLGGASVVAIGNEAFKSCSSMSSVRLPVLRFATL